MGSIAKKGFQQYLIQLQRHPLRTKALTAGFLSAISDVASQKLTGIQKLQLRRLVLKVLFGVAYLGPFGHFLHLILDKIFKGKKDNKTVAKKVLLEQLTSSPWNNLFFMLYYGLVVEVLACSGVDKSPVCATPISCHLPELGWVLLGNIPKFTSKICEVTKGQVKRVFSWPQGSRIISVRNRVDEVDDDNYVYNYTLIEGDASAMEKLELISYEVKFEATPEGGSKNRMVSKYHSKGDIVLNEEDIKAGREKALGMYKVAEAYLLQNPDVYT